MTGQQDGVLYLGIQYIHTTVDADSNQASKMARGGNLLFPLILALILGLLLYFYWGASSQAHRYCNHGTAFHKFDALKVAWYQFDTGLQWPSEQKQWV